MVLATLALGACTADPTTLLEDVAKDWSLTIRASQVIPVYPLSEDIQPGDVFLVQVSIAKQAEVYNEKGFLPTDNHVARLDNLPYRDFYKDSYLSGSYAATPHPRPGPDAPAVMAPRAAFPSYTFTVDRSGGLQLALPIQGVPFGLGLMSAARATGTLTISDSYSYGVDGATIYEKLVQWHRGSPAIQQTLQSMARADEADVFLRAVTRVYLAGAVDVSLANADALSGGADVGTAQEINLPDLTGKTDAEVASATKTYADSLAALSGALNGGTPGGSVQFTQVDRSTVSMKQKFDRPLVIGFVGFDLKVFKDGSLSAPIPSFSVLSESVTAGNFRKVVAVVPDDGMRRAYVVWLRDDENKARMRAFMAERGLDVSRVSLVEVSARSDLRPILEAAAKMYGFFPPK